jgi:hypothetical protein
VEPIIGGYYLKARCAKNSWIATAAPCVREVWDYLLREANHTDTRYKGFTVRRGQLFRTYPQIREALKWRTGYRFERYHLSAIKRAMLALAGHAMVELLGEPWGTLITIVNYAKYQDMQNYGRTTGRSDGRTTNNKEEKKKRININILGSVDKVDKLPDSPRSGTGLEHLRESLKKRGIIKK